MSKPQDATCTILFGEPYAPGNDGPTFEVGPAFYEVLRQPPESLQGDDTNAYRFGPQFPLEEYQFAGGHGNDGAQTGFLDITNASRKELKQLRSDEQWHDIYGNVDYDWNDRKALKSVQSKISRRILFVGETTGGDVGANLFLHRDAHGQIDGVLIDNEHVFPGFDTQEG